MYCGMAFASAKTSLLSARTVPNQGDRRDPTCRHFGITWERLLVRLYADEAPVERHSSEGCTAVSAVVLRHPIIVRSAPNILKAGKQVSATMCASAPLRAVNSKVAEVAWYS